MTVRVITHVAICTITLLLGSTCPLFGEEPAKPIQITLHPQAAPIPSLKYRLLPTRLDQKRGNAAVYYGKVTAEETKFFSDKKIRDELDDWQDTPLAELRGGKAKLPSRGHIEDTIRRGAVCMDCDWLLPIDEGPYYQMMLSEVQQTRGFGRILAVRARIQIADHEYDDAITTIQTAYALGRHVASGETLVNGLVGIAICNIMNQQVREYVQQLGAPNLYWALTALPSPMIDMQLGMDVERMGIEMSFPDLANARTVKKSPDEWHEMYERVFTRELGLQNDDKTLKLASGSDLDKRCRDRFPAAKEYLITNGIPAKEVEAMSMYQVATLYTLALYHDYHDDAMKCNRLPYSEAAARIEAAAERAKREDREILPISKQLIKVISSVRGAAARLDREIAMLRVFEALRIYAASHGDKLPGKLSDITEVPVPNDAITDKPFEYHFDGDKASLRGPTFHDVPVNFEITMTSRH
jgi:hypothetical protein